MTNWLLTCHEIDAFEYQKVADAKSFGKIMFLANVLTRFSFPTETILNAVNKGFYIQYHKSTTCTLTRVCLSVLVRFLVVCVSQRFAVRGMDFC